MRRDQVAWFLFGMLAGMILLMAVAQYVAG